MQRIVRGSLRVITLKDVYHFPNVQSIDALGSREELKAELRVIKDVFWLRLFAVADLGFAEAYMYGEVECNDLVSLFKANLAPSILQGGALILSCHRYSFSTARTCLNWTIMRRICSVYHKS